MTRKAVILAAGRGTRMGALTEDLPKPMLPIEGKPILEHIVRRLQQAGLTEILIVTGYRREPIEEHFARGFTGISFALQKVAEGTAAALKPARAFVGTEPFVLTFGDIMCDFENYEGICSTLARHSATAVIGAKNVDDPWQGAAVYADESGVVARIVEKPPRGTSTTRWNSAGLYAFAPAVFEELDAVKKSARGEYEITSAIQQLIDHARPVRIFEMRGAWLDVGRPEDIEQASRDLNDCRTIRT